MEENLGTVEGFDKATEPTVDREEFKPEQNNKPILEEFPVANGDEIHIIFEFKVDGKKYHEHHIISDKNKLTANHKLWKEAGVDPQSRMNKIFLPTEEEHHETRSIHKGRHWEQVSKGLEKKMEEKLKQGEVENWNEAQYKNALEELLKDERKNLKTGKRALNSNKRAWSNNDDLNSI